MSALPLPAGPNNKPVVFNYCSLRWCFPKNKYFQVCGIFHCSEIPLQNCPIAPSPRASVIGWTPFTPTSSIVVVFHPEYPSLRPRRPPPPRLPDRRGTRCSSGPFFRFPTTKRGVSSWCYSARSLSARSRRGCGCSRSRRRISTGSAGRPSSSWSISSSTVRQQQQQQQH